MGYTVKVNHPHFPEGTPFNVGGLDRVENGGSLNVDDEMERLFIMSNGKTLEDAFANDHAISVSGSSSLDNNEVAALLEAYAPAPVEEAAFDVDDTKNQDQPAWLAPKTESGEDNA